MTTIVMVETDDDVLIAYDSRLTGRNKVESPDHKVFVNNGVIYGMSGSVLYANATRYTELPAPTDEDPAKWLTNELTPVIRDLFDDIETSGTKRSVGLLIVIHGEVFELSSSLGWNRNIAGKYSIGSGYSYALGALSAGVTVSGAVHIAAMHDECTGDTVHYTTAETLLSEAQ